MDLNPECDAAEEVSAEAVVAQIKAANKEYERGRTRRGAAIDLQLVLAMASSPLSFLADDSPSFTTNARWFAFCRYFTFMGGLKTTTMKTASPHQGNDDGSGSGLLKPTDLDVSIMLKQFIFNDKEPILYRAFASFLVTQWFLEDGDRDEAAVMCLCRCSDLMAALTPEEGQVQMWDPFRHHEPSSAFELPNSNRSSSIRTILQELERWAAARLQQDFEANGGGGVFATTAPKVTSSLLRQVRDLPQRQDVLFYLQKHEQEQQQPAVGVVVYDVFAVGPFGLDENADIHFWPIASVACHSDETRAKHVLASFCQACLFPESTVPGGGTNAATTTTMPYRPASILLETQEDADHPTVVTFFGMMGYPAESIGVLDESMQAWLRAYLANDNAKEDTETKAGNNDKTNKKKAGNNKKGKKNKKGKNKGKNKGQDRSSAPRRQGDVSPVSLADID
jgi:hypothetical protein